ncbi:B-4DMT family transporter [Mycobacterium sp.]|uniref:B-4DMT family transporter n=1 Tax=Mycobacterium sp. TaxID=1785 RepID=UPI003BABAB58
MTTWMLRGVVFAAAMVVVRLFQGTLINAWPAHSGLISLVLLLFFLIGVIAWGLLDGLADAKANPDPDRRQDLAMTWLLAGLVAGVTSGAAAWLISLFYKSLYVGGLVSELSTFAAFTALLVFVPALSGVAVGRWEVDRQLAKIPVRHHGLAAERERADTDVFAAVRADDTPTGEITLDADGARQDEPTAAIATAERDDATNVISTTSSEAPTEVIHTEANQIKPFGEEPTKN